MAGCVLDVGLTGEAGFGTGTADATQFVGEATPAGGTETTSPGTTPPGTDPGAPPPIELRSTGSATLTTGQAIELRGDVDVGHENDFTVSVAAGQIAYIEPASDCGSDVTRVDIAHAGGGFIAGGTACKAIGRVVFADAGDYEIKVSSAIAARYAMIVTGVPADRTADLPLGTETAGTVSTEGAQAVYRYEARAGEALFYQAPDQCPDRDGKLRVSVRSAAATIGEGAVCSAIGRIDIREDGPVQVIVAGTDNGAGSGSYRFTMFAVPADQSFNIRTGDQVSRDRPRPGAGTIESPGSADRYVFSATAGDTIDLVPGDDCAAPADLRAEIRAPDGGIADYQSVCKGLDGVALDQTGAYVIVVSGTSSPTTGTYSFTLRSH